MDQDSCHEWIVLVSEDAIKSIIGNRVSGDFAIAGMV